MVLFLLQQAFGDQQRHVNILDTLLLKFSIHDALNILPDGVAIGAVDEHALNRRIIDELGFLAHIGKPLRKVHLHIGDLCNLLFLCHFHFLPWVFYILYSITSVKWLHRMEHIFFGRCKMISVTLELPPEVALFYTRVACTTGKPLTKLL